MIGVRTALALMSAGAVVGAVTVAPARAGDSGADRALAAVRDSGGHYQRNSASLRASDCSGLVSVAQSIATGQPVHRLGNTGSLLAGHWPGAIAGASPSDVFVIGSSPTHMVASIQGVNIEARSSGEPYRVGADARSPWSPGYRLFHIDPSLLVA